MGATSLDLPVETALTTEVQALLVNSFKPRTHTPIDGILETTERHVGALLGCTPQPLHGFKEGLAIGHILSPVGINHESQHVIQGRVGCCTLDSFVHSPSLHAIPVPFGRFLEARLLQLLE